MARGKLEDRGVRHDAAYRRAKRERYAARAVYKLQELDAKFRLLRPGQRVLDLGCWPGSWLQYAAERVGPTGSVLGIDLRGVEVELPTHVSTIVGDVERLRPEALVRRCGQFDVLLADLAPATSGDRQSDAWRSEDLFLRALEIAALAVRPGGHFAAKVFQGGRFGELLRAVRREFQRGAAFRPSATRLGSREQYVVGRGRREAAAER